MEEISGDKFPIGGGRAGTGRKFTSHKVDLVKDSMVYMSTDGFADQFGGQEGKKFRTKRFKELLGSLSTKPIPEQNRELGNIMQDWMKNTEQLDDILVTGIRIS